MAERHRQDAVDGTVYTYEMSNVVYKVVLLIVTSDTFITSYF